MKNQITCWCEQSIPPFSIFWIKEILNPSALAEPVAVVFRPESDLDENFNYGLLNKQWSPVTLAYTTPEYVSSLRPEALTNGVINVPAKTVFAAEQLMFGAHWLRYDDSEEDGGGAVKADPESYWFFPRVDTWALGSTTGTAGPYELTAIQAANRLHGPFFYRIGRADTIQKCVPVIMVPYDD